jgi:hypothetical protein
MPLLMLLIFLIVPYKTLCLRVIRFEKMASLDDFGIEEDIVTSERKSPKTPVFIKMADR